MNAPRTTQPVVELTVESPSGQCRSHRLGDEDQVLVGTSDHCGMQLRDDAVSNYHCVISFENGNVWVQDWSSASETLVNGQPISGKTAIGSGDELCVGRHKLVPRLAETVAQEPPPSLTTADLDDSAAQTSASDEPIGPTDASETETDRTLLSAGIAETEPNAEVTDQAPEDAQADLDPWTGAAGAGGDPLADFSFPGDSFADDMFDRETVELLRAEVEELRAALAGRDAAADELGTEQSQYDEYQGDGSDEDNAPLIARLDELLEEAERSDERIAVLEEMLHAAEQANQAGQEERHQLQQWIGDIENRIGQREAEWKAEIESYQSQLADAHGQRDLIQQQLKQAAQRGGAPQGYGESLERLQQRNQELQDALTAANKERAALKERLEQGDTQSDQSLREERAQIAQERAAVSRMRHELSSKLAALEEMPEPNHQPDREFTGRLQTLREHLREIHAQERQEREQRESTLTGRLSKLWNRLEA